MLTSPIIHEVAATPKIPVVVISPGTSPQLAHRGFFMRSGTAERILCISKSTDTSTAK